MNTSKSIYEHVGFSKWRTHGGRLVLSEQGFTYNGPPECANEGLRIQWEHVVKFMINSARQKKSLLKVITKDEDLMFELDSRHDLETIKMEFQRFGTATGTAEQESSYNISAGRPIAAATTPTSEKPSRHSSFPSAERGRGVTKRLSFPAEKFGHNMPVNQQHDEGYIRSNALSSRVSGGLKDFPAEKFCPSARSSSATDAEVAVPGAHAAWTTEPPSEKRGTDTEEHYYQQQRHDQFATVLATIPNLPPSLQSQEELRPNAAPSTYEDGQPQEYLVEASLVATVNGDTRDSIPPLVEATEVTIKDIFQVKGVWCLFGSMVGCFCLILTALVVALVLVSPAASSGSDNTNTLEPSNLSTASPTQRPYPGMIITRPPRPSGSMNTALGDMASLDSQASQANRESTGVGSPTTTTPTSEQDNGSDGSSQVQIVVVMLVLVGVAMVASIPLFLVIMRRKLRLKLQLDQHQRADTDEEQQGT